VGDAGAHGGARFSLPVVVGGNLGRMLIYLDQNAYDPLLDSGLSPDALSDSLQESNHELILGDTNLQEWASCWKSGNPVTEERGRRLVALAHAIRPRRLLTRLSRS
jgi:hypothetical protein